MNFTKAENDYLLEQKLMRVSTASLKGMPDIATVFYKYFEEQGTFLFGGLVLEDTIKYKNLLNNNWVTVVVDDVASWQPYSPRGIKLRGKAELITQTEDENVMRPGGLGFRITPVRKWVWGVNSPAFAEGKFVVEQVKE